MDISILIPNRNGHEALELCLESVWRRTAWPDGRVEVVVFNSPGDGRDRPRLCAWAIEGKLRLIEGKQDLHHGEALTELLSDCGTPAAVLLESDCEVIRSDWLSVMAQIASERENIVAVGRYFAAGPHCRTMYAPIWGPECLWLDMGKYRLMAEPHDWQQRSVKLDDYPYREIFAKMPRPWDFDGTVNLDTCWRFSEKIIFENRWGYKVAPLPKDFFARYIVHYGGLSTRADRPEIRPRWERVRERLRLIRQEA